MVLKLHYKRIKICLDQVVKFSLKQKEGQFVIDYTRYQWSKNMYH